MFSILFYTHVITVVLFMLLTIIRVVLLLMNRTQSLDMFIKRTAIPERIAALFLLGSGVYLITQVPEINFFMILKLLFVVVAIPLGVIAYKRKIKFLAIASLLLFLGAIRLVEVSKKESAKGSLTQAATLNGQDLFTSACSQCHGDDGKKGAAGAADLSVTKLDVTTLRQIIMNGKGSMPDYKNILDEKQVALVADYIRAFKK